MVQAEDKRVTFVKLADRLHNMRTIGGHADIRKQQKIADETLKVFVLMAKKLGLVDVAQELQERSAVVMRKKSE